MYSLGSLHNGIRNPRTAAREVNKLIHTRGGKLSFNPDGVDVLDEDWDNLIILDACRYDVFADISNLPGRLGQVRSKGGATYQFIRGNFSNRHAHDTVYVGSNTWFLKLRDEINAEVHSFIDLQHGDWSVEWVDKDLRVVTPETVTKTAIKTADSYPKKRLIVHYLQPHHPFIGPTGRKHFDTQSSSLLDVVGESDAGDELLEQAYRENLEAVLPEVEVLLETLEGKSVVTADHGEMLGDRHDYLPIRDYGHHLGIYNEPTVGVPWLIYNEGRRKEIVSEKPERREADIDAVDKQLQQLGYKID